MKYVLNKVRTTDRLRLNLDTPYFLRLCVRMFLIFEIQVDSKQEHIAAVCLCRVISCDWLL